MRSTTLEVDTELAGARKAALESRAPTVDSTQPSRVLSYKDIREAHHIMEAAKAGKKW